MTLTRRLLLLLTALLAACAPGAASNPARAQPAPTHSLTPSVIVTKTAPAAPSPARAASPTAAARSTRTPRPTTTPEPAATATLPANAEVKGMNGYGQLLALSCEARAAADWARHFGVTIHELDFLSRLPRSNNPERGFVGSVNGSWGQIPPAPYGVHAAPVAETLRGYGAQAQAERKLSFRALQEELAAGRPVIVWVVGHVEPGKGTPYHVDGETVTVARYEHTVIVTGYDAKYAYILDGKNAYRRATDAFLASWAALENMAIVWQER